MAFWSKWLRKPDLDAAIRDKDVKALLRLLRKEVEPLTQIQIVRALGQAGDGKAVEGLSKLLTTDSNTNVRVSAARALGKIGDVRAVPALVAALDDMPESREPVLRSNEVSSYSDARPTIVGTTVTTHREVATAAKQALSDMGPKAAGPLASTAREMVRQLRMPSGAPVRQVRGTEKFALEAAGADTIDIDELERNRDARRLLDFISSLKTQLRFCRPTLR